MMFLSGGQLPEDGKVGIWTDELEKQAEVYWVMYDGKPHRLIVTPTDELHIYTKGYRYLMEIDGYLQDVSFDSGDVISDSKKELIKHHERLVSKKGGK